MQKPKFWKKVAIGGVSIAVYRALNRTEKPSDVEMQFPPGGRLISLLALADDVRKKIVSALGAPDVEGDLYIWEKDDKS
ncbi:hypothetical protein [Shimazuella alba]|uniref:Uncharacterized protein n=1 Tax=Shimazuella alba TaxID=2690964 RepID=A0A6I4VVN1_9BACL|nr:hypothetical protein [Shimazuella alba]MXQ53896.1 hypothetical protein [Shimazuella alba]